MRNNIARGFCAFFAAALLTGCSSHGGSSGVSIADFGGSGGVNYSGTSAELPAESTDSPESVPESPATTSGKDAGIPRRKAPRRPRRRNPLRSSRLLLRRRRARRRNPPPRLPGRRSRRLLPVPLPAPPRPHVRRNPPGGLPRRRPLRRISRSTTTAATVTRR